MSPSATQRRPPCKQKVGFFPVVLQPLELLDGCFDRVCHGCLGSRQWWAGGGGTSIACVCVAVVVVVAMVMVTTTRLRVCHDGAMPMHAVPCLSNSGLSQWHECGVARLLVSQRTFVGKNVHTWAAWLSFTRFLDTCSFPCSALRPPCHLWQLVSLVRFNPGCFQTRR